jgi:hypothetical protein
VFAPVIVLAAAISMVAACDSGPTQEPTPSAEDAAPTLSEIPPPLVPAMPLPDNAIENAVGKLDGIADDLMKKSGIPGDGCRCRPRRKDHLRQGLRGH